MKKLKENLIFGLEKSDKMIISNLVDKYVLYEKKKIPSYSNFLDLRVLSLFENRVKNLNISYKIIEKIPDCEKKVVWFGPLEDGFNSITIYHGVCKYPVRHPEVLGSLFQIGLQANTIGDIVVEDNEFYFTNLTRLNSFVEDNLVRIGKQKVTLNKVNAISLTKKRYQEITIVVNSMRLDTVISRLANISRNGALEKLKNKEINVNFQEVMKPTYLLKEQDILSIRKVGKFKIGKILHETRKNKILLEIKKYN